MNFQLINVGIADLKITESPNVLRTILGSCVGICLHDKKNSIAGLSHIMLPQKNTKESSPKKYADSAIPLLLEEMKNAGCDMSSITAKIVGGATMFKMSSNSLMGEIGKNNILHVRKILAELNIKIIAEDVGGDYGRTMDFFPETGEVRIKSLGHEEKII